MTPNWVYSKCAISLAILGFIWLFVFRQFYLENSRQMVAAARNNLFTFLWKNGHRFDTKLYLEMNQRFDDTYQLLDHVDLISFVIEFYYMFRRGSLQKYLDGWDMRQKAVEGSLEAAYQQAWVWNAGAVFMQTLYHGIRSWFFLVFVRFVILAIRVWTWRRQTEPKIIMFLEELLKALSQMNHPRPKLALHS